MKNYTGIGCARVYFCNECGKAIPVGRRIIYRNLAGEVVARFCDGYCANLYFDDRRPEDI